LQDDRSALAQTYKLQATRVSAWSDRTDSIEARGAGTLRPNKSFTGSQSWVVHIQYCRGGGVGPRRRRGHCALWQDGPSPVR
jgi:hypothetical protein